MDRLWRASPNQAAGGLLLQPNGQLALVGLLLVHYDGRFMCEQNGLQASNCTVVDCASVQVSFAHFSRAHTNSTKDS